MLRRTSLWGILVLGLASQAAVAQSPNLPTELPQGLPGSNTSVLGTAPGSGGGRFSDQPAGGGPILGGRPGSNTPRVPTSISTPGGGDTQLNPGMTALPRVAPPTEAPLYGSLDIPAGDDEGPPNGLTLNQAIDLLIRLNQDLLARRYEIPLAQADILTASLRANPIFYADAQLVPYGEYTPKRPGGQTQYDTNVSIPIDYSRKRPARVAVASAVKKTVEAQYQDAVRMMIRDMSTAYVAVLSARESVRYVETGARGLEQVLAATRELKGRGSRTSGDVDRIETQLGLAKVGILDAGESLRRAKRALGGYLNMTSSESEQLELRASLRDDSPPLPGGDELLAIALQCRPDVVAYKFGVQGAKSSLKLQQANRYADAYLLAQPYTYQNNSPMGLKSSTSFAVGITVPLPLLNRNQGNIERARTNIQQTQVQLEALKRQVAIEVRTAEQDYLSTKQLLDLLRTTVIPRSKAAVDASRALLTAGELIEVTKLFEVEREYNQVVRQYRDYAVRHRQSMIGLNYAVGAQILP